MPRKGENIYKRKDGRWEGRYIRSYDSEHKAKYAYVYGKTYSEVKRKRYYGKLPGIHVYCTNPRYYSMLHINPFRFNQGIHVLEHLDRLIEIFNA